MTTMVEVETPRCYKCEKIGFVTMSEADYNFGVKQYANGAFIQDAFPNQDAATREQLKTGIHPECWKEIFAGSES